LGTTVFLITPPFTQLNTPYPATAYLKGFLNTRGIASFQADLGIEVILRLFSQKGLTALFENIATRQPEMTPNCRRIVALKPHYIETIDPVIGFLQGRQPTLAHRICNGHYLPKASRFEHAVQMGEAFGNMGLQDKAKYLATMYLEDLSDLIKECVDEHFGFSRYAERLGRSANHFDELYEALQQPYTFIDELLMELLSAHMEKTQPRMVALSVPFPGNLYSSLRCGQWIKAHYPLVKVAMGGGFANTELRSLRDERVFEFYDFISLDDGEAPIENLVKLIQGDIAVEELKRTYTLAKKEQTTPALQLVEAGEVEDDYLLPQQELQYFNNPSCKDYKQGDVGTPDYSDLLLDQYIDAIEVVNPMHRLWSDGRWNKLTMAHGCYWAKCTFCDVSLDYIKLYEPITASLLCDRMEQMMSQTGTYGFHFVDEAAPPALMRALSLEIIRRKLPVVWWTNVRFEKSFTRDLCVLLKAAGCIAVSGGLEVASDRLLELIQKGITVAQVAQVNRHFTEAGIMVHAYLMYAFPTQTDQETIDSLEMVRQMFKAGILQSGFWHQFAMTAHSPVGLNPKKFGVKSIIPTIPTFADNDVIHEDPTGADHESYSLGLKKSLFNYMSGIGLEEPLHKWFERKVPKTTVAPDYIEKALEEGFYISHKPNSKVVWLGQQPVMEIISKSKKGSTWQVANLHFEAPETSHSIRLSPEEADWLMPMLEELSVHHPKRLTLAEVQASYEQAGLEDFLMFWDNKPMNTLWKAGLLVV
jgi:hypothetical protein